jgi:anti-anti-sigma factor
VAVSALEVSVATGTSGPVLVLTGEADVTSVARLDEALTAQVSGQAVRLTIDATDLRYADSASMRTLLMAAAKITGQDGTVTLLNPQPPVARLLDLLGTGGMITVEKAGGAEGR